MMNDDTLPALALDLYLNITCHILAEVYDTIALRDDVSTELVEQVGEDHFFANIDEALALAESLCESK